MRRNREEPLIRKDRNGMVMGHVAFPLVMKSNGKVEVGHIRVASFPSPAEEVDGPGVEHYFDMPDQLGREPRLHLDMKLWRDSETKNAVAAAWCVVDDGETHMYVDMFPAGTVVSGVSLGVATAIAMCGIESPEQYAFTGFLPGFGRNFKPEEFAVMPVDCETTKMNGLSKKGVTLVMSERSEKFKPETGKCIGVKTFGDALRLARKRPREEE
jgi:hypothetical protein